jgi:hypothetical protein
MPERSDQSEQEPIVPETGTSDDEEHPVPDMLSGIGSVPQAPEATPGDKVPEWLSNLEANSEAESGTSAALFSSEPSPGSKAAAETPDWLSRLQAEANAGEEAGKPRDDLEVAPELPAYPGNAESLPDWLAGIGSTPPSSTDIPALVVDNQDALSGGEGEAALSMEEPDWLSKLTPDQATEKAAENKAGQTDSENIEAAELPSWVQAMRPVEAVLDSKTPPLDENQITELSGPLAGLRGVLPAGPGMGQLQKPPTYTSKLQVSDGQHRYAKSLEQLVAGETHPRGLESMRLPSNRLWRWCIAVLLFLAVGLPFASGVHFTPPTLL